jgi:ketosteroid isomerase-like protein
MTGEAEAIVRRTWDAVNRHSSADALMAEIGGSFHDDVEFVNPPDALERGTRKGVDGMRLAFENFYAGAGPDAEFEFEHLTERGERVFAKGRLHGVGATRGMDVGGPGIAAITTMRDGLIYRVEWFWDKDLALAKFERETAG